MNIFFKIIPPPSKLVITFFFLLCFVNVGAYGQTSVDNCDSSATTEATLTVAGSTRSGSLSAGSDPHYFQIDMNERLIVAIIVTFPFSNDQGYSLQLCDSNDYLIASAAGVRIDDEGIVRVTIETRLRPETYYIVVGSSVATTYNVTVVVSDLNTIFDDDCPESSTTNYPDDPLYGCQWYLKRQAGELRLGELITGEDINIEEVWDDAVFGAGINVAVVDHGMDTDHEDLADNVDTTLSHDYSGSGDLYSPSSGRGTRVAGIIAAVGDNSLGVRGVAPEANIYSYNLADNFSDANAKDAMVRNMDITAVSVNNWGPKDLPVLTEASSEWEEGVETGIREGFGGKGVFYVWAAGDGHEGSDQANFNEYSSYYAVTTVCSAETDSETKVITKSSFSEEGYNLWVCAPGSGIVTTDNNDIYTFEFPGTSNSAAVVSGIAALIREVNSDISWRDLKLILAGSASQGLRPQNDPNWRRRGHKYGSDSERYDYGPKYGFGMVDAAAAVELAGSWNNVPPPMRPVTVSSGNINTIIPDLTTGNAEDVSAVFTLNVPDIDIPGTEVFTEFIEIGINFTHPFFPFLDIEITSPDGTVSKLTEEYASEALSHLLSDRSLTVNDFKYTGRDHRFGLANHLGTDPAGEWTLKITNNSPAGTGTLHSWNIKVYGHMSGETPTFNSWTIPDKNYVPGTAIKETLPEATAGNGELTYSLSPLLPATGLPAGLAFSETDRVISGTPTAVSSGSYTYTVTDEDGDTDELNFTIRVTTTPPGPTDPPPTSRPRRPTSSGSDGGGGGCVISDQNEAASDLLTAVASLMLIPVSVVIRRKIRSRIET